MDNWSSANIVRRKHKVVSSYFLLSKVLVPTFYFFANLLLLLKYLIKTLIMGLASDKNCCQSSPDILNICNTIVIWTRVSSEFIIVTSAAYYFSVKKKQQTQTKNTCVYVCIVVFYSDRYFARSKFKSLKKWVCCASNCIAVWEGNVVGYV